MTYRPAITDACPVGQRGWTLAAYARHSVSRADAERFAARGISPDLARPLKLVRPDLSWDDVSALASILSRPGIRNLLRTNRLVANRSRRLGVLARLAHVSTPQARAWVHRTLVPLDDALALQQWGVRPSSVANWVAVDPLRRPPNPFVLLKVARISLGPTQDDLDGWLRFCVRHQVPYRPGDPFLGGDTALMVRAGFTPSEAGRLVRSGRFDRDAVTVLAGLRS